MMSECSALQRIHMYRYARARWSCQVCLLQVLKPFQAAVVFVVSSPCEPDMHGLLEAVQRQYFPAARGARSQLPPLPASDWRTTKIDVYSAVPSNRQIGQFPVPERLARRCQSYGDRF